MERGIRLRLNVTNVQFAYSFQGSFQWRDRRIANNTMTETAIFHMRSVQKKVD